MFPSLVRNHNSFVHSTETLHSKLWIQTVWRVPMNSCKHWGDRCYAATLRTGNANTSAFSYRAQINSPSIILYKYRISCRAG